jgi:DNA-directed RNA polymerase specialized sigma24 family protein
MSVREHDLAWSCRPSHGGRFDADSYLVEGARSDGASLRSSTPRRSADYLDHLFLVTGDLHEAEEVVQEAFARASVRWSWLRDYSALSPGVRRVAIEPGG